MNTKHTPGPWHNEGITAWKEDGLNADQPNLATAHGPNAEANARLIAAAPELLEALQAWHYAYSECTGTEEQRRDAKIKAGDMTRAAIAKATGNTNL